jgi:hypothetical protein
MLEVGFGADLDPNEDLLAIHPKKKKPIDSQRESSQNCGPDGSSKDVQRGHSQVDAKAALYKILTKMSDEVRGDGIHPDDDQWKRKGALLFDIDDP